LNQENHGKWSETTKFSSFYKYVHEGQYECKEELGGNGPIRTCSNRSSHNNACVYQLEIGAASAQNEESEVCVDDNEQCTAKEWQQDDTLDYENDVIARLERLRDSLKDDLTLRLLAQASAKVLQPVHCQYMKKNVQDEQMCCRD
jgi:hypothetical protein